MCLLSRLAMPRPTGYSSGTPARASRDGRRVTRPEPLRELSLLQGVPVTGVRRARIYRGNSQPDGNAWQLAIAGRASTRAAEHALDQVGQLPPRPASSW